MWSNEKFHLQLVKISISTITLESCLAISIKAAYTHNLCPNTTRLYIYPTEICTNVYMCSHKTGTRMFMAILLKPKQSKCPSMLLELIKISYSPKLQRSEPLLWHPSVNGEQEPVDKYSSLLFPILQKTLSIMYLISVTHLYIGFFFLTVSLFHFLRSHVSWSHSPHKIHPSVSPRGAQTSTVLFHLCIVHKQHLSMVIEVKIVVT